MSSAKTHAEMYLYTSGKPDCKDITFDIYCESYRFDDAFKIKVQEELDKLGPQPEIKTYNWFNRLINMYGK